MFFVAAFRIFQITSFTASGQYQRVCLESTQPIFQFVFQFLLVGPLLKKSTLITTDCHDSCDHDCIYYGHSHDCLSDHISVNYFCHDQ